MHGSFEEAGMDRQAASGDPKLTLVDLTCAFGNHLGVDGLNLNIAEGEFLSLLGPSGCGKTTTLRMIAGFIRPTAGRILMDGRELSSPERHAPPEKRNMSMIFQSYAIWPHMSVAQNVAFGLRIRKVPRNEIRKQVAKALDVVRLSGLAERYPAELSGGQQQRVALARAIVVEPSVLLLDEPLSNLDANLREEMRFEIKRLHVNFRITTVYVTHDQSEAMVMSDRIAVMNKGRLEQIASPQEIYNRPNTRFVASFIGRTNLIEARSEGGSLKFAGIAVERDRFECGGIEGDSLVFSLRPEAINPALPADPVTPGHVAIPARIIERSFLGSLWEMVAETSDEKHIRFTVPARRGEELDETVRLEIEPSQFIRVK